ncbi:MAG TPA: hypothetical protein VGX23_19095 [Actinocrinis sp.]|nr:hypothetical protein [Actinocrinis sp.]
MIPARFDDFFTASASVSGALIGLLFVAITVAPERAHHEDTRITYNLRASAAMLVFSNSLTISLAALVPGVDLGWWALLAGLALGAFGLASGRSGVTETVRGRASLRTFRLIVVVLLIAGFEAYAGVRLIQNESDVGALGTLDYVVIGCLVAGIDRSWELMSMRSTGMLASLVTLAKGDVHPPASQLPAGAGAEVDLEAAPEPEPDTPEPAPPAADSADDDPPVAT